MSYLSFRMRLVNWWCSGDGGANDVGGCGRVTLGDGNERDNDLIQHPNLFLSMRSGDAYTHYGRDGWLKWSASSKEINTQLQSFLPLAIRSRHCNRRARQSNWRVRARTPARPAERRSLLRKFRWRPSESCRTTAADQSALLCRPMDALRATCSIRYLRCLICVAHNLSMIHQKWNKKKIVLNMCGSIRNSNSAATATYYTCVSSQMAVLHDPRINICGHTTWLLSPPPPPAHSEKRGRICHYNVRPMLINRCRK